MDANTLKVAESIAQLKSNIRKNAKAAAKPYSRMVTDAARVIEQAAAAGVTEIDMRSAGLSGAEIGLVAFASYSACRGLARAGKMPKGVRLTFGGQPLLLGDYEVSSLTLPPPKSSTAA